jgi:hypothetical protein
MDLAGIGSILGGLSQGYGAYVTHQGMKDMAAQQNKANQLAREQFAYAKQLDKQAAEAQGDKQNEMELGLAASAYGRPQKQL